MQAQEIQAKMTEHRQFDVTRNEVLYRWDFGVHHVTDKCYAGREAGWIEPARARAAALIAQLMERQ